MRDQSRRAAFPRPTAPSACGAAARTGQELDDARLVDEAILGRVLPLTIEQVGFHVHVREQQCILKHVADPALVRRHVDVLRGVEEHRLVDANRAALRRGDPRDGVDDAGLAGAGTTKEADDGGFGGELDVEVEGTELLLDLNVDHRVATPWRGG